MFTPAIRASKTSAPSVIIVNAFCTAVTVPPFLNRLPFAEETTSGLTALWLRIMGKPVTSDLVAAMASPATALLRMKSRRFIFLLMWLLEVLEESTKKNARQFNHDGVRFAKSFWKDQSGETTPPDLIRWLLNLN